MCIRDSSQPGKHIAYVLGIVRWSTDDPHIDIMLFYVLIKLKYAQNGDAIHHFADEVGIDVKNRLDVKALVGKAPVVQKSPSNVAGAYDYSMVGPVSYTHLDVYKRQILGFEKGSVQVGDDQFNLAHIKPR